MTDTTPHHSLHLDERQRALLHAMGVPVWWPSAATGTAPPPLTPGLNAPVEQKTTTIANKPYRESASSQKDATFSTPSPPSTRAVAPPQAVHTPPAPRLAVDQLDRDALHAAIGQCQACGLCQGRTHAVAGSGPAHAEWMVVLDSPNEHEDRAGQPMAGPDGPLLHAMLAAMGLNSAQVAITHAVKCRSGLGHNPTPSDIAACRPHLQRQLALVQPHLVLALGRLAAQAVLGAHWPEVAQLPLGKLRGQVHHTAAGVPVVVSYPPSSLLRSPTDKAKTWEDLCLALAHAGERNGAA